MHRDRGGADGNEDARSAQLRGEVAARVSRVSLGDSSEIKARRGSRALAGCLKRARGKSRAFEGSGVSQQPAALANTGQKLGRGGFQRRIDEALTPADDEAWRPGDTAVVLVGRGALVPDANAEHYRIARLVWDEMGLQQVLPAFIQVNRPSVPDALSAAAASGLTRIVVAPVFLFTGKLSEWLAEQVGAWVESHPGVEVRIAHVIDDCDEIADVVVDRYRRQLGSEGAGQGAPVYLSGLRLQGRRVLVVGAGHVAERRIPQLLEAGARVRVVAPSAGIKVSGMAARGQVELIGRGFRPSDVDDAWYVVAAANDAAVNQQVAEAAEARRIFCVRSDRAIGGSAYTPATEQAGGISVAVVGDRNPRRSVKVREELLRALQGV